MFEKITSSNLYNYLDNLLPTCSNALDDLTLSMLPIARNANPTTTEKITTYSKQFFHGAYSIFKLPIAVASDTIRYLRAPAQPEPSPSLPLSPFSDRDIIDLPEEIGVATAEYQVNGAINHPNTNWAEWEVLGHIEDGQLSGKALDHWHNREAVINRIKDLGIKHYRFSVERSALEPTEGQFDLQALEHYADFCRELLAAGIKPMITLHHFTDPLWFYHKGGFENPDNIDGFIEYAKLVFNHLSPYVKTWATFNETNVYTFSGYIMGEFPPGKTMDLDTAGHVLHQMLIAHTKAYNALKQETNGSDCEIGITHQFLRFKSYHTYNPIESLTCKFFNEIQHDVVMRFFKEGVFDYRFPFMANIYEEHPEATNSLDFIGVQYYARPLISMDRKQGMVSTHEEGGKMTNMPYRFDPKGLEPILEEAATLKKPIYITEIGIDAKTPEDQEEYYATALKVVSKMRRQGVDIKGLYFWSLDDNFEWALGWKHKFGIYDFDSEKGSIQPKKIAQFVRSIVEKIPKRSALQPKLG